jgi:hypothetical protein
LPVASNFRTPCFCPATDLLPTVRDLCDLARCI